MLRATIEARGGIVALVGIVNDETGSADLGNYDVEVMHGNRTIRVRVEGFRRDRGPIALLAAALDALERGGYTS